MNDIEARRLLTKWKENTKPLLEFVQENGLTIPHFYGVDYLANEVNSHAYRIVRTELRLNPSNFPSFEPEWFYHLFNTQTEEINAISESQLIDMYESTFNNE